MIAIRRYLLRRRLTKTFYRTLAQAEEAFKAEVKRYGKLIASNAAYIYSEYTDLDGRQYYEDQANRQRALQEEVIRNYRDFVSESYAQYHKALMEI